MTAHDKNLPETRASRTDTAPDTPFTRASRDKAAVIVWRVTADPDGDADIVRNSDAGDSPLSPRLARHLVAIYSDVHGTVIDFDADINLQRAAEATGRVYSTITDVSRTSPGTHLSGPAALILLRWPRPNSEGAEPDANSLLSHCQQHLAHDGSTIVVVTAVQPGADGTSYADHEQILLPAARAAGLRHLHDIVPIDTANEQDVFTYATDQRTARLTDSGAPRHNAITTLVIFGHPGRRA
jgi:hypothetical protein